jgi:hypothetical protein
MKISSAIPGAVLTAMLCSAIPIHPADVHAVLAAPRQRIQTADYRATGHMVKVDKNGNRISFPFTIKAHWFPGVLRVLFELGADSKTGSDSPASAGVPVHILFELRPSGQSAILLVHPGDKAPIALPFEKWSDGPLGSGFSFEDFLEQQYFWPLQAALETANYGARKCDVLSSKPGAADKTHYAEVRTWLDQTIGFPVYVEKSMKATGAVKEFVSFGLRHEGGVWSASQVEVKVRGQAGSTLLIVDRGTAKANLGLADFSPAKLKLFP